MAGEQLRVIEGKDRGELVSVGSELLLGRVAPEGAGRLGGDPKISRRHAAIRRGADQTLTIEDLGSANGTFVNEEEIDAPRALSVGDLIRVGRTVMQVTDASGQVPDAPAAGRAPATEIASPGPVLTVSPEPAEVLVVTAGRAVGQRLAFTDELVIGRGVEGGGALDDDLEL